MATDHVDQLESTINRLIEKHERVKREKELIEKKLQQKESEWHHLKGQLRQYERERTELREKLDRILGQRFTISSEAEEGYMLKVAGYVDGKMQELMQTTKPVAKSNVAMLAALNIADELHRLKDSHEAVLNRLDQLLKRVSTTVSEED